MLSKLGISSPILEANRSLGKDRSPRCFLHVCCFCGSNDDGIGDFSGLTEKLEHIRDLGATAIWLLPFYPSPLRDDGYDIADYLDIHPDYGTLQDLRAFVRKAHRLGLKVITELVVNHISDQHPWFQEARTAPPGSAKRKMYVWSESDQTFADTRIIFTDTEASNWTWDLPEPTLLEGTICGTGFGRRDACQQHFEQMADRINGFC